MSGADYLYSALLMEHYRCPQSRGVIENPNFSGQSRNVSCGDTVSLTGLVQDNIVVDSKFEGNGCILSQAVASLLMDYVRNKPVQEIWALTAQDVCRLAGVQVGPNRLQCVALALDALQKALEKYA